MSRRTAGVGNPAVIGHPLRPEALRPCLSAGLPLSASMPEDRRHLVRQHGGREVPATLRDHAQVLIFIVIFFSYLHHFLSFYFNLALALLSLRPTLSEHRPILALSLLALYCAFCGSTDSHESMACGERRMALAESRLRPGVFWDAGRCERRAVRHQPVGRLPNGPGC